MTEGLQCIEWFYRLASKGASLRSSDLCDYEVRRELVRINSTSIEILDELRDYIEFETVTPIVLQVAAQIWAERRGVGQPNTALENIDIDCILAAHWTVLKRQSPGRQVIIATKNIQDFQQMADCAPWQDIHYP
ncbi:MAG: hypothetical protein ACPGVO_23365 [Spirulinaceae cyanobacterium]